MRGSRHNFAAPPAPEQQSAALAAIAEVSKFAIALGVVWTIYIAMRPWILQ